MVLCIRRTILFFLNSNLSLSKYVINLRIIDEKKKKDWLKFALARKFINAIYLSNKKNKLLPLSLLIRIDLFSKKRKKQLLDNKFCAIQFIRPTKKKGEGKKKKILKILLIIKFRCSHCRAINFKSAF